MKDCGHVSRLDATVQSFSWSDRVAARQGELGQLYRWLEEGDVGVWTADYN